MSDRQDKNTHADCVGLMADSHGQIKPLQAGIDHLRKRNCKEIYHLGDVCDSAHPETAEICLRSLIDHGVKIIKGNNDHVLVANYKGQAQGPLTEEMLAVLANLPLRLEIADAIFTHSLPFEKELGLTSMIKSMAQAEIEKFFKTCSHQILFRGHSHAPEITWLQKQKIHTQSICVGKKVCLVSRTPCIVTCGALTRGLVMLWRPAEKAIESVSYRALDRG